VVTIPIRDQSLAAQPGDLPIHTSLVWGPVDDPSQSLSSSATPHTHPFLVPTSETIHAGHLCIVVDLTSIDTIHAGFLPLGSPDLDLTYPRRSPTTW
jgi:hypothetical protein